PGSTEEDIVTIKRDGELIRRLTNQNFYNRYPAWSKDGASIAWLAETNSSGFQLCTIDTSGASRRVLTTLKGIGESGMAWSPASDRIVFADLNISNSPRLFTIRRDGTGQEQLTSYHGTPTP